MRVPVATYRVQLHKGFGFRPLGEILSYLSDLGISDVYASPIFKARKGSLHGYDVVAPGKLNPELGDPSEFEKLVKDLKSLDMGWLQDIVPNHMAFDAENEMLRDVLENGARSPFLEHFDVWWDHPYTGMKGRLLAPFLGKFYGESLEEEEINLRFDKEGFTIAYYDLSFPLKIESYTRVLTHGLEGLKKRLGRNHPDFIKLLGMLYVLKTLSSQDGDEDGYEQIAFIKNTLWELYTRCEEIRNYIEENLLLFNGGMDPADRVRRLDPLLSEQLFRLSFWKVATEEINYRRFFSINDLISLRVEREEVFRRTHGFLLKLVEEGSVTGLRVDHIDGLHDPKQYLNRLREGSKGMYTVVEKILEPGSAFLVAFLPFQQKVAQWGVYSGLSQTLIKLTSPGVPDIYQGSELWDLRLVDPDNRRPVDYEKRRAFLKDILAKAEKARGELIAELLSAREDGRIKLYLICETLKARKNDEALFQGGAYVPLHTTGTLGDQVIAFGRHETRKWAVTVAPRFFVALTDRGSPPLGEKVWKDTALVLPREAPERWRNALTGEKIIGRNSISLAEILRVFPAALLMSEDPS